MIENYVSLSSLVVLDVIGHWVPSLEDHMNDVWEVLFATTIVWALGGLFIYRMIRVVRIRWDSSSTKEVAADQMVENAGRIRNKSASYVVRITASLIVFFLMMLMVFHLIEYVSFV